MATNKTPGRTRTEDLEASNRELMESLLDRLDPFKRQRSRKGKTYLKQISPTDYKLLLKSISGELTPAEERRVKKLWPSLGPVSKAKAEVAGNAQTVEGALTRKTVEDPALRPRLSRSADHPAEIERIIPVEARSPNIDNARRTGKTGTKDEGLVQEPQSKIGDAGIATVGRSEQRLNPRQLSAFLAHAVANKWDGKSGVAPSEHIKATFAKWLGRGLWREHIVKAQPNLASAYAAEVSRDPSKRVEGLAVRPHKLPPGAPRAPSARPIAELSEAEKIARREKKAAAQQRWRLGRQSRVPSLKP